MSADRSPQPSDQGGKHATRLQTGSAHSDVRDQLLEITRQLVGTTDQEAVLQTIVETALTIVPTAQKCVIHLLSPGSNLLIARYCSQPALIRGNHGGIPADQGIAGLALTSLMPIYTGDTTQDVRFIKLESGTDVRSLLVAPLAAGDLPLGTISLSSGNEDAFDSKDCEHTTTLAAQASVVIQQTQLLTEARLQRDQSDAIIESIIGGVLITNGARLVRANPGLYRLLDLDADEVQLPCTLEEIPRLSALLEPIDDIVGPYSASVRFPIGREITVLVTPADLATPSQGKVIVLRDVTEERIAAESRSLFISQVSHELRKPLQHILGFVSLLTEIEGLSTDDQDRFHNHIEDETYRMARLVDDLVAYSSIQNGRFALLAESTHIDSLLADIVERLAPHARLRDVLLSVNNTLGPIWVLADPMRLEQVIVNLVENALRYVPAEGEIIVSLKEDQEMITIQVKDTGCGIAADRLDRIFGAYYQDAQRKRRHEGMGLGLYICQQIIQLGGGRIWAESIEGEGSTFAFTVPKDTERLAG